MGLISVDHRNEQTRVGNQGDRQTCVAFAVTAAHEWMTADRVELSQEFAHWAAKTRDGRAGEETSVQWTLVGIADEGQALLSAWPYGTPAWPALPPLLARDRSARREPGPWRRMLRPGLAEIATEVTALNAVVLTLRFVPRAWYQMSADEIVDADPGSSTVGSHAVLVVGVRWAGPTVPDALLVKNSWGEGWGDAGYGLVAARYLTEYGVVAHVLEAA